MRLILILFFNMSFSVSAEEFPSTDFFNPISENDFTSKRIIGEANFEKIRALEHQESIFNTARRVAFLNIENITSCTGSLVGPDLLLTNAHCIMDMYTGVMRDVTLISIYMEYINSGDIGMKHAQVIRTIKSDRNLDYALLQLDKPLGNYYGWLELADKTPTNGDVMVIQHPSGREKEISRVQSSIANSNQYLLHYYADTEPGSSGSPVFSLNGKKLIALHHAGACRKENLDKNKNCLIYDFNEGIVISNIKNAISEFLPPCALDGKFPGEFVNKCAYISED
ncbi:MAG: serine protease [Marinicella sp.]